MPPREESLFKEPTRLWMYLTLNKTKTDCFPQKDFPFIETES